MRSIITSLLFFVLAAVGSAQINPGTQITWPTGPTGCFYVPGTNTCALNSSQTTPALTANIASASCTGGGCGNSIALPFNVAPGDAIILEMIHSNGGTIAPSDTQGDTFTLENYQLVSGQLDANQYVVCNAIGGATTISAGSTPNFSILAAYEVSGVLAASGCVDTKNSAQANSVSSLSTGSVTTANPYEFLFVSGATRTGMGGSTVTEGNGYTQIYSQCGDANQICYGSFYGIKAAIGSVSDLVSVTNTPGGVYAGILALKPAVVEGDVLVAGPTGQFQPVHAGTLGYCWISNGPLTVPTYQVCPGVGATSAMTNITGLVTVSGCTVTAGLCAVSGGSTATIDLSSIPGTYNHLVLYFNGATTSGTIQSVLIQLNADSAAHYNYSYIENQGSSPASGVATGQNSVDIGDLPAAGSGHAMAATTTILNYAGTTFNKELITQWVNWHSSDMENGSIGNEWDTTPAAVNEITITLTGSSDFEAGTTVSLYGVL